MLRERLKLTASLSVGLLGAWLCFSEAAQGATVAGLVPDQRPANAPTVPDGLASPSNVSQYLYGVVQPVPGNVTTIAATGWWFVPLRSPGMHAPYDLRGWHAKSLPATKGTATTSP
jgi:hypothetical protein